MNFSPKFTFVLSYGKKRVCSYVAWENIHRKHVMPFSQPFFASEQKWSNVFDVVRWAAFSDPWFQEMPPQFWVSITSHLDCTSTPHIFLAHYIADQKDLHFCLMLCPTCVYHRVRFFILGYTLFLYRPTSRLSRCTSNMNACEFLPNSDNLFHEGCFAGSWRDICQTFFRSL